MSARSVVVGLDAEGEDVTVLVALMRAPDGRIQIDTIRVHDHHLEQTSFFDFVVRGWRCPTCGAFNGEERIQLNECRACPTMRAVK